MRAEISPRRTRVERAANDRSRSLAARAVWKVWGLAMQEITFNGKQYRVEGDKVWMHLDSAGVHRLMKWGTRKDHWRALPKNSPLRRYLVKIARGEKAELPRLQ
jgi:hypothetical protein